MSNYKYEGGEGRLLLEQIRTMSKDLLENLMELDNKIERLQNELETHDEIDREHLKNELAEMRTIVGALEKEDTEEIKEEEILENMMKKLNDLIEMTIG